MPPPDTPVATQTNALAVISLVSGLLGWTVLPLIGCIVAIITGHLARSEIRRNPHMDGNGLAMAGLVLGYAGLVAGATLLFVLLFFLGGLAYLSSVF